VAVRAVRGATQVPADDRSAIMDGTTELVLAVLAANELRPEDLISVIFTATPDLTAEFPALAARKAGLSGVPLLCASEIDVPGALPRVVRLMAHVETERSASEVRHVYLHGATALRPDLERP
jgi:chorismate mutase